MSELRCSKCEADLKGANVIFDGTHARCGQCNTRVSAGRSTKKRQPSQNPIPANIEVRYEPDGSLFVRVPWRLQSPPASTQLAWMSAGAIVALVSYEIGFSFWAIVAAVAFTIAMLMGVRLFNQTLITVRARTIRVRHAPVPWRGSTLDASAIDQLYVDRRPLAQKRFDYSVIARNEDGDETPFLQSLSDPMVALYLERCFESHLQIEDVEVAGAFRASQMHPEVPATAPAAAPFEPGQR